MGEGSGFVDAGLPLIIGWRSFYLDQSDYEDLAALPPRLDGILQRVLATAAAWAGFAPAWFAAWFRHAA
jgi:hypothetical protein